MISTKNVKCILSTVVSAAGLMNWTSLLLICCYLNIDIAFAQKAGDFWKEISRLKPSTDIVPGKAIVVAREVGNYLRVVHLHINSAPNAVHQSRPFNTPITSTVLGLCAQDRWCDVCFDPTPALLTLSNQKCKPFPNFSVFLNDPPESWKTKEIYLGLPTNDLKIMRLADLRVDVGGDSKDEEIWSTEPAVRPGAKLLHAKWVVFPSPRGRLLYLLLSSKPIDADPNKPVAKPSNAVVEVVDEEKPNSASAGLSSKPSSPTSADKPEPTTPLSAPAANVQSALVELIGASPKHLGGSEKRAAVLQCLTAALDRAPIRVEEHYNLESISIFRITYPKSMKPVPKLFGEPIGCLEGGTCPVNNAAAAVRVSSIEINNEIKEPDERFSKFLGEEVKRLRGVQCRVGENGRKSLILAPLRSGSIQFNILDLVRQGYELKYMNGAEISAQPVNSLMLVDGDHVAIAVLKRTTQKYRISLLPSQQQDISVQDLASLFDKQQVVVRKQDPQSQELRLAPRLQGDRLVLAEEAEFKPDERLNFILPFENFSPASVSATLPKGRDAVTDLDVRVSVSNALLKPVDLHLTPVQYIYGREIPLSAVMARDCQFSLRLAANRKVSGKLSFAPGPNGALSVVQKGLPIKGLEARTIGTLAEGSLDFVEGKDDGGNACPGSWSVRHLVYEQSASRISGKVIVPSQKPVLLGIVSPRANPPQHWDQQSRFAEVIRAVWENVIGAIAEVYETRSGQLAGGDVFSVDGATDDHKDSAALLKHYFVSGGILEGLRPTELRPTEQRLNALRNANSRTSVQAANFTDVVAAYRKKAPEQLVVVGLAVAATDSGTCRKWRDDFSNVTEGAAAIMVLVDDRQSSSADIKPVPCVEPKNNVHVVSVSIERLKLASISSVDTLKGALKEQIERLLPQ